MTDRHSGFTEVSKIVCLKSKHVLTDSLCKGGFEVGGSAGYDISLLACLFLTPVYRYNGSIIVDRSLELGEPLIYVSFNYRVSGSFVQLDVCARNSEFYFSMGISGRQRSEGSWCREPWASRSYVGVRLSCAVILIHHHRKVSFEMGKEIHCRFRRRSGESYNASKSLPDSRTSD